MPHQQASAAGPLAVSRFADREHELPNLRNNCPRDRSIAAEQSVPFSMVCKKINREEPHG